MMAPSFNITATEIVLPRISLDFTNAVLDPRITFLRSFTRKVDGSLSVTFAPDGSVTSLDMLPPVGFAFLNHTKKESKRCGRAGRQSPSTTPPP